MYNMKKKGYVYLLKGEEGKRYIGSTNDLKRRLKEHQQKHGNSKYTKMFVRPKVVYYEDFETIEKAREYEKRIKKSRYEREKFYKKAKAGISSVG